MKAKKNMMMKDYTLHLYMHQSCPSIYVNYCELLTATAQVKQLKRVFIVALQLLCPHINMNAKERHDDDKATYEDKNNPKI